MATIDCESCQDFKEYAPGYIQNGLSDAMCTSLQNDTGLKSNSGHDDCEDLNTINDCTIGSMDDHLEAFEACDWREYMHEFVPNLYMLFKAMICALCGIWTNIHSLWTEVNWLKNQVGLLWNKIGDIETSIRNLWEAVNSIDTQADRIDCLVDYMMSDGFTFRVGETFDTTKTHVVAGEGVSVIQRGAATGDSDVYLQYIGGALCRGGGAIRFHSEQFTDEDGSVRAGNPVWAQSDTDTVSGNELIYELRIKRSEYPQVKSLYGIFGQSVNMYSYTVTPSIFWGGSYAYGQHGSCDTSTGQPPADHPEYSTGHLVPDGWVYVQLRMAHIYNLIAASATQASTTPRYIMGITFNKDAIEC